MRTKFKIAITSRAFSSVSGKAIKPGCSPPSACFLCFEALSCTAETPRAYCWGAAWQRLLWYIKVSRRWVCGESDGCGQWRIFRNFAQFFADKSFPSRVQNSLESSYSFCNWLDVNLNCWPMYACWFPTSIASRLFSCTLTTFGVGLANCSCWKFIWLSSRLRPLSNKLGDRPKFACKF